MIDEHTAREEWEKGRDKVLDIALDTYARNMTTFSVESFLSCIELCGQAELGDVECLRMHPCIEGRLMREGLAGNIEGRFRTFMGVPVFSDKRLDRGDGKFATQINMRDGSQLVVLSREL